MKNYATLKKIAIIALEKFAEIEKWTDQTQLMAMSIMQHHRLSENEITAGIPWHRDNSNKTLVILLDDERQWEGGNFLFRRGDEEPVCYTPMHGRCVLFSNEGTQHCLEPFTAKAEGVNRTILTIHQKLK